MTDVWQSYPVFGPKGKVVTAWPDPQAQPTPDNPYPKVSDAAAAFLRAVF